MGNGITYALTPIDEVQSSLARREDAPQQGIEGSPDAWLEIAPALAAALGGLVVGQAIVVITWLHQSHHDVLRVHPRDDEAVPLAGVFATRSPDRPNPLGLHGVQIREIAGHRLKVGPLEAIDRTPIVDLKPVLAEVTDS